MKVYQVRRIDGIGLQEAKYEFTPLTGYIYTTREKAEEVAKGLWEKYTTPEERASSFCSLHFDVIEDQID